MRLLGGERNKQMPLWMQVPLRKAWLVQPLTTDKAGPTLNSRTVTLKHRIEQAGLLARCKVHSPRCSEYCKEKLVCDDAELAVNDTFRDVSQCSNAGSGFDRVGCLPSQKSAESTGLPQSLGLELALTVCTAAPQRPQPPS